jgi:hypothetical protein
MEARSLNHCCSGKVISIIYSECVFLSLYTQREMRLRHIVICGLTRSTRFFDIIPQMAGFFKKKITVKRMCASFSTTFVLIIFHSKKK